MVPTLKLANAVPVVLTGVAVLAAGYFFVLAQRPLGFHPREGRMPVRGWQCDGRGGCVAVLDVGQNAQGTNDAQGTGPLYDSELACRNDPHCGGAVCWGCEERLGFRTGRCVALSGRAAAGQRCATRQECTAGDCAKDQEVWWVPSVGCVAPHPQYRMQRRAVYVNRLGSDDPMGGLRSCLAANAGSLQCSASSQCPGCQRCSAGRCVDPCSQDGTANVCAMCQATAGPSDSSGKPPFRCVADHAAAAARGQMCQCGSQTCVAKDLRCPAGQHLVWRARKIGETPAFRACRLSGEPCQSNSDCTTTGDECSACHESRVGSACLQCSAVF
jgi:hypothetical protein